MNNYKNLVCDANFLISVRNTIIWVVCSLVTQVVLPLSLIHILEHSEEIAELEASIKDYITQCQAKWVAGQSDINADWDRCV